ncbi:MAG: XRE family transcriptional regulator [Cytophagia bacterium]|jgi:transcriptional regulator with XRE-family HTH domain|nr:MAG: XRE family transcriptional regulator [Cytophagales bacterium]TAG37504.1 MAG: XRE family transcriptional regulator [Cytophagia bacterium]TAG78576.1 MAG: XRE family transcriptional regulator [Cytophagales bacterium]
MTNLQNFGNALRKIRLEKGLKLENIADELGITTEAYRKIESGKTKPNTNRLVDLEKVFKMDLVDMFSYCNDNYNITKPTHNISVVNNGTIETREISPDERLAFQQILACNRQLLEENQSLREQNQSLRKELEEVRTK